MSQTAATVASQPIAGSFRDPSGHVFSRDGRIFRAVDAPCAELLHRLQDAGVLPALIERHAMVKTDFVSDERLLAALRSEHPGFQCFLEHERLTRITYPYEWCISMLADAGVLTLDLQLKLLAQGCALKDATAYNVQFVGGSPRFIDVSSIEQPQRMDIWFALGQFAQMFVYPLLLCRYHGWDLRSYFLANLGGRSVEQVARGLKRLDWIRPSLLLDVTLPCLLTRWAEKGNRARREVLEVRKADTGAQITNLRRLRSKILKLAGAYRPRGVWSEYTEICNYDATAEQAKVGIIRTFLDSTRPRTVLDLGCNTGEYSRLAADCGAEVVAVDSDHDAVELLYRKLRQHPARITPMVVDLCNPSPGIGFMNRERSPFFERAQADCVFALALLHHLLVAGNLPLESVCEMLSSLTARDLVLEFIPTDDNMFQRLMNFRVDLFRGLSLESVKSVFEKRFRLLREEPLPNSKRTLLFLRRVDIPQ